MTSDDRAPQADDGVHEKLIGLAKEHTADLDAKLEKVVTDGDVDGVHDVRVASRRLTEVMRLLGMKKGGRPPKKVLKSLREIRQSYARVRDLDVVMASLEEERKAADEDVARGLDQVLSAMKNERVKALEKASPAAEDAWDNVEPRMAEIVADSEPNTEAQLDQLKKLIEEHSNELLELIDGLGQAGADPHQVRISAKRLRYTLELAAHLGDASHETMHEKLKELQSALGEWHDAVVAADELVKAAPQSLGKDPKAAAAVLALAATRLKSAGADLDRVVESARELAVRLRSKREAEPAS